jgi:hypothetical protein
MRMVLVKRTGMAVAASMLIFLSLLVVNSKFVLAPPPSSATPSSLSEYGVVRVCASNSFTGVTKITVTSDNAAPFFVERIYVFLNTRADSDILLDNIVIDGTPTIQISGYSGSTKVVVVPAGFTVGEVINSIPSNLDFLLVRDPLGNSALSAGGGAGNGVVAGLRFMSAAYSLGTTVYVIALVTAVSDATISMTIT